MHSPEQEEPMFGVIAEFDTEDELLSAAEKARDGGFKKIDAYSPYPIHGMIEALGKKESRIPWLVLVCGFCGFFAAIGLQVFTSVFDYPMNIGGRPLLSWPAFIPIVFELTILFSVLGCVFGMIAFNGLPLPYHPLFNVEAFKRASRDGFFLGIEATDPQFETQRTKAFLEGLKPKGVYEVES